VVCTLPEQIAAIAYQNKQVVYDILFQATAETLKTIAADPKHLGAEIGFFAVLHSWGQNLMYHPHLHCVVPGGGLSPDKQRWVHCRAGFFLPVRVLSRLFRRLFLERLQVAFHAAKLQFFGDLEPLRDPRTFAQHLAQAKQYDWVVYAKRPFAGPQQVLDYVGRYTHRVALSNNRLIDISNGRVRFQWKDYRHDSQSKVMDLDADEFIRRFLLHVLPQGLQRIRYYGFLANRERRQKLALCRQLLRMPTPPQATPNKDYRQLYQKLTGRSLTACPRCQKGQRKMVETLLPVAEGCSWIPHEDHNGNVNGLSNRTSPELESPVQRRRVLPPLLRPLCRAISILQIPLLPARSAPELPLPPAIPPASNLLLYFPDLWDGFNPHKANYRGAV
jgi:hypothetical protein